MAHTDTARPSGKGRAPFLSWVLLWLGGILALVLFLTFRWTVYIERRILPGVIVDTVGVGGRSMTQAAAQLAQAYPDMPLPPVEVQWQDRRWLIPANAAYLHYDTWAAAERAYRIGREGSWQRRLQAHRTTLLHGTRVPLNTTLDTRGALTWLHALATRLYRPLRPPDVLLEGETVYYTPGTAGRELDLRASWERVRAALQARAEGDFSSRPVELVVREVGPPSLDISELQKELHRLIHPVELVAADRTIALDPVLLRQIITLTPVRGDDGRVRANITVDEERLRSALEDIASRYARDPIDARLDYDPQADAFIVLSPSRDGWAMDVDEATRRVKEALLQGVARVSIPAGPVRPRVPDDATPAQLGIHDIVGEGTTYFRGSSPARVHNIVRAAEAVRGVVIPPGGVFSFNEAAGAITAANGYEDSLIIWGDRTAVGIGGGVCQVSTTLFRAVFFAGLPILERWNHGYIVSWYGKPGLDATVYSPHVDFKFKNTTQAYLLIQPIVDTRRGVLTFRLWGTKPDWTVEIIGPTQEDVTEPPPPVYREDPTLPKGTIRQVEWAKPGMVVRVRRIVRRGEEILEDREFVSRYQPWRAVYLYGPGTKVPGVKEEKKEGETGTGE